jgi:hypothetical protein
MISKIKLMKFERRDILFRIFFVSEVICKIREESSTLTKRLGINNLIRLFTAEKPRHPHNPKTGFSGDLPIFSTRYGGGTGGAALDAVAKSPFQVPKALCFYKRS